jgi:hypothetical protein
MTLWFGRVQKEKFGRNRQEARNYRGFFLNICADFFPDYCHITAISPHKVIRGVKFSILLHYSMPLDLPCRTDLGRNDILYYGEQRLACHPCRKLWLIFSHTIEQSGGGVFIIFLIRGRSLAACSIPRSITYTLFLLAHFVSSGCRCRM